MCRAFELVLVPQDRFDIFNIGSGTGHSVAEVIQLIEQIEGQQVPVRFDHPAASDELAAWVVLDSRKAREKLGWASEIPLSNGLERMLASTQAQS
jgi:nucleoside-diphosphate-sugar epimerase